MIFFLIFSPLFLFNRENYKQDINDFFNMDLDTKVLSLVHIETFEGSMSSRGKYLEKLATLFNKKRKDVYITIKTLTIEELELNFEDGFCDIVSFGYGVGDFLKDNLIKLKNIDMHKSFLESGKSDGEILAYPYSFGGYATITRQSAINKDSVSLSEIGKVTIKDKSKNEYSFGFAKNGLVNIAGVLKQNNITTKKELFYENDLSTYNMYEKFLANKFATLIGTTRDVVRCKDREVKGSLSPCVYNYLGGFTDLVQYLGITSKNYGNQIIAQEFLEFALSEDLQRALNKVGLFSPVFDDIYEEGYLKEFENVLSKDIVVPNAFLSKEEILRLKNEDFKKVVCDV